MSRIYWNEHKGKKILCGNYADALTNEVLENFAKANHILMEADEQVLVFVDLSNISIDQKVFLYLRNRESKIASRKIEKPLPSGSTPSLQWG